MPIPSFIQIFRHLRETHGYLSHFLAPMNQVSDATVVGVGVGLGGDGGGGGGDTHASFEKRNQPILEELRNLPDYLKSKLKYSLNFPYHLENIQGRTRLRQLQHFCEEAIVAVCEILSPSDPGLAIRLASENDSTFADMVLQYHDSASVGKNQVEELRTVFRADNQVPDFDAIDYGNPVINLVYRVVLVARNSTDLKLRGFIHNLLSASFSFDLVHSMTGISRSNYDSCKLAYSDRPFDLPEPRTSHRSLSPDFLVAHSSHVAYDIRKVSYSLKNTVIQIPSLVSDVSCSTLFSSCEQAGQISMIF